MQYIIEYIRKIFCIYFPFLFVMYVFDLDNFMEALHRAEQQRAVVVD